MRADRYSTASSMHCSICRMLDDGLDPAGLTTWMHETRAPSRDLGAALKAPGTLDNVDRFLRDRMVEVLTQTTATPVIAVDEGSYTTALGGVFLLLPLLADMMSALDLTSKSTWTQKRIALLRLLILSSCMGAAGAVAFRDPVLRFACGLPADGEVYTLEARLACLVEAGHASRRDLAANLAKRALALNLCTTSSAQ